LAGGLLGGAAVFNYNAATIDQIVDNTFVLLRQIKSLEEGEGAGAAGLAALKRLPNVPALEAASRNLKGVGTALRVVGTAAQVATVAVEAVEYSNDLDQAQTNYDNFTSQANQIYNSKLKHLKKQFQEGEINIVKYHGGQHEALLEAQEAENDASWFQTVDQAIAGFKFFEHGLATFTPIPPSAIDATSKAIAGVPR
jgi:hypothetical protein